MKREKLIAEIAEAIEVRLNALSESNADLWDCWLPPDTNDQMARVAVAVIEAFETGQKFAKEYAG